MNKEIKQIFDAFGTEVKIGDWIYYPTNYKSRIKIAKIKSFTKHNNPKVVHEAYNDYFMQGYNYIKNDQYPVAIQAAFVKCCNQALIETLEELIK